MGLNLLDIIRSRGRQGLGMVTKVEQIIVEKEYIGENTILSFRRDCFGRLPSKITYEDWDGKTHNTISPMAIREDKASKGLGIERRLFFVPYQAGDIYFGH